MSKTSKTSKTSTKANNKKRVNKHVLASDDEASSSEPNSTEQLDTSHQFDDDENEFVEEDDEEEEVQIELDTLSIKSDDSKKSDAIEEEEKEEGQIKETPKTKKSKLPDTKKYDITDRFGADGLKEMKLADAGFVDLHDKYLEEMTATLQYELLKEDGPLTIEEQTAFEFHSKNLADLYFMLASKGKAVKQKIKFDKRQAAHKLRTQKNDVVPQTDSSNVPSVRVVSEMLRDKPQMLTELSVPSLELYRRQIGVAQTQVSAIDPIIYMDKAVQDSITSLFHAKQIISKPNRKEWERWPIKDVIEKLLPYISPGRQDKTVTERMITGVIKSFRLALDCNNSFRSMQPVHKQLLTLCRSENLIAEGEIDVKDSFPDKRNRKAICETILVQLVATLTPLENRKHLQAAIDEIKVTAAWHQVPGFSELLHMITDTLTKNQPKYAYHIQMTDKSSAATPSAGNRIHSSNFMQTASDRTKPDQRKRSHNSLSESVHIQCPGCGKPHPNHDKCYLMDHPDFNTSSRPWDESYSGKFWKSHNHSFLVKYLKRDGAKLVPFGTKVMTTNHHQAKSPKDNKVYENKRHSKCYVCSLPSSTNNSPIINTHLYFGNDRIQLKILLDTGAENGSYISSKIAAWLQKRGMKCVNNSKVVCSCFGDCRMIETCINANLIFKNVNIMNSNCTNQKMCLDMWVINTLPYGIVIGNLDIDANPWLKNLDDKNLSIVIDSKSQNKQADNNNPLSLVEGYSRHPTLHQSKKVPSYGDSRPSSLGNSLHKNKEGSVVSNHGIQPKPATNSIKKLHVSKLLNYEPEANGILEKWDSLDESLNSDALLIVQNESTVNLPTHIMGTTELQSDIKDLLVEFSDIFRKDVSPKPADVPSMDVKVDKTKWNTLKGNMGVSPRVQSRDKNNEIQTQVEKMLELGVIQRSNANRYSQVLLVPKPNNKWRFCIDYQPLNACCEGDGWNLPNIQQMLQRLGSHKPKLFAVMDLTSGYHQAPINVSSRVFTAFITFMGIFEWLRVPMGLKGAASYFQKVLATVVLIGLLYYVCELYIDDIIVHAQDAESFLSRLRQVFERLRKHNITLNPEKCKFGLQSVEYVGHTIDETGLSFSTEKLDEVLAISPPTFAKELRSFLGLASYFRDHIQNLATIAKPLQDMIVDYEKKRKLIWTHEAEEAFKKVKEAIKSCPKLFFMDDHAPVFLHTDASDYGIGAYLFQIIDGCEQPIAFMSKTLSAEEIKWSTIEKECYAIVFALRKFEYLLRDKHFTLRTDHANLTYVNDPPSPKVRRWKIAIQEYDFDLEYIEGEKNVVADGFSRLLPISVEIVCVLKGLKIPDDKYKLLGQVHNTNVGHHGLDRMLQKLRSQGHEWKEHFIPVH